MATKLRSYRVPDDLHEDLKTICSEIGVDMTSFVLSSVETNLKKQLKKLNKKTIKQLRRIK